MSEPTSVQPPVPVRPFPLLAAVVVTVAVAGCSIWVNCSFAVTNRANFARFPPFQANVNANDNKHLGAEYLSIARALLAGDGFANPFKERTGPTAWMPPVLPVLLAGLQWACGTDPEGMDAVMTVMIFLQVLTLIGTGLLVLALTAQTNRRLGAILATCVFITGLTCHFHSAFQFTHDSWLVMLALDLVIAGFCFLEPLRRWPAAVGWGLVGGFCALVSPIVGLVWGVLSVALGVRQRRWLPLAVTVLVFGLALAPWTVRNYLVFGRLVPVKSNAAYELYQSQCLQPDGLLQGSTFGSHPWVSAGRERQEYKRLGEMAFLDRKKEQFWQAVRTDPEDFLDRVACRFLGATVWYVPMDRTGEARRPWTLWYCRLTHPLPFLAMLVLLFSAIGQRLHRAQWMVIGVYLLYLTPYVAVSYYERYAFPLLAAKVLLVIWAVDRLYSLVFPLRQPRPCPASAKRTPVPAEKRIRKGPESSQARSASDGTKEAVARKPRQPDRKGIAKDAT